MASFNTISIRFNADLKQFSSQMQNAQRSMQKYGKQMQNIGKGLTLGVTLPVLGLGAAAVKAASDAEETASKFNTVFRDISDSANKAADELRNSYGLSGQASKQLLSDTGDLLTGFGFSQDAALDLSSEVNKLAVDLASFTNFSGGAEGASQALTKALLGERESVKSLGISILEADVKAKVLENTQKGLTFESERQAKAFATLQLAQEQSKNAIGDYARTSDSFANQMRLLKARLNDVAVQFGEILLPYVTKLAGKVKGLIDKFSGLNKSTKTIIVVVAGLAAALGPLLVILGTLMTTVIPGLITAWGALQVAMTATPWGAIATAVGVLIGALLLLNNRSDETVKKQTALQEVSEKAAASIAKEKAKVEELLFIARDENVSKEQRIKAIKELNKISPKYLGNLNLESINTDKAREAVEKYNEELLKTAKVKAAQEKLQEIQSKMIEKELELSRRRKAIAEEESRILAGNTDNAQLNELQQQRLSQAKQLLALETENGTKALEAEQQALLEIIGSNKILINQNNTLQQKGGEPGRAKVKGIEVPDQVAQLGSPLDGLVSKLPDQTSFVSDEMQRLQDKMERMKEIGLIVGSELNYAFQDFTSGFVNSLGLANDGLEGFAKGLIQTVTKLISMMLAQSISQAIAGATASGTATGPAAVFTTPSFIATAVGGVLSAFAAIPKFADGGLVYGPTVGLMGEYSGARNNPEVIAPLDKLKSLIGGNGPASVQVTGVIRGRDIHLQNARTEKYLNRRS